MQNCNNAGARDKCAAIIRVVTNIFTQPMFSVLRNLEVLETCMFGTEKRVSSWFWNLFSPMSRQKGSDPSLHLTDLNDKTCLRNFYIQKLKKFSSKKINSYYFLSTKKNSLSNGNLDDL